MVLNEIATFASAAAAIVGIVLTCIQISASNKQALFDRRLKLWTEVLQLAHLYDDARDSLKDDGPVLGIDFVFCLFTNSASLYKLPDALKASEPNAKVQLLTALETMRVESQEAMFAFKGEVAETISTFLSCYATFLDALYKYGLLVNTMNEQQEAGGHRESLEHVCEKCDEGKYRQALFEAKDKLEIARAGIKKLQGGKTIKKQVQL